MPLKLTTPLTVKELRMFLSTLPDDMEILETRYSDFRNMTLADWKIEEAHRQSEWVMRHHPTMKQRGQNFLHFQGN